MGEAARVIDRVDDLEIPNPDRFYSIMSALGDEGQAMFSKEIVEALDMAQQTGDLRHVQNTLDAWSASWRFGTMPKIHEAFANAAVNIHSEKRYSADDVAEFFGVA